MHKTSTTWLITFFALQCFFAQFSSAQSVPIWPDKSWKKTEPNNLSLERDRLVEARDYALQGGGSGIVTCNGQVVVAWGDQSKRYDLKSTTKSIGSIAMGLAIEDGKLNWRDKLSDRVPKITTATDNPSPGLGAITLLHLATQTSGFAKSGGYQDLLFRPGTKWHYSDCGPNWIADCVTLAYQQDASKLLFDRVFSKLGITNDDLTWRQNAYRSKKIDGIVRREFGSGISANVDAMARIGYLFLRQGKWRDEQLLSADFVKQCGSPQASIVELDEFDSTHGDASTHYGLLWWNNADGALVGVPRSTYWSWGLYDSLIVVIPELDIVAVRVGKSFPRKKDWSAHYDVLQPFIGPISRAAISTTGVKQTADENTTDEDIEAPYPKSDLILRCEWDKPESITRHACGGDNWPITWGDDDKLYTAYGDGNGFAPKTRHKLSMGFASVTGSPEELRGTNIRSESGETTGDGVRGKKASGILMVDRVLYLLARNAENSQLAWSDDHARTWQWADWKFTTSFGYPTFLNFGKNYSGARDDYVYVYSHDSDSAYTAADRMVMARVPATKIRDQKEFEFFNGLDEKQQPIWTNDVGRRGTVFEHPGKCYRSGITYNASLKRYFWCQIHPPASKKDRGPRFEGGFGIYESPDPWGPWKTVYFTNKWDVGPGETSSFPTKWMTDNGRDMTLLFSGNDCFSLRRVRLKLAD